MAETVTVALKHPHGLILQLCRMVDAEEPGLGGTKAVKRAERYGDRIKLNGYSVRASKIPLPATEGEFALTHNVPKDFMEAWLAQNQDLDLVKSGLLKVSSSVKNDIAGYVRSVEKLKSGLEPIDPERPPMAGVATYNKNAA